MITPSFIYLITRADDLKVFFLTLAILALGTAVGCFLAKCANGYDFPFDPPHQNLRGAIIKSLAVASLCVGCGIAIPSTKDIMAMYAIPATLNSQILDHMSDFTKALSLFAKDYINSKSNNQ